MQTRPRSQICKCCMQCTCNCNIRPVLAAAATASEFNTTSILVQRLFSGDLEVTEAHQQILHTYQSF